MKKIIPILILGMVVLCGLEASALPINIANINTHTWMEIPNMSVIKGALDLEEDIPPAVNFTIIALPDTQHYASGYPTIFTNQTQWIVDHKDELNIVYVTGEGDITDSASDLEFQRASTAYSLLEDPVITQLPYGIPYTIPPGNHDKPYTLFNQYFGVSRFTGRDYYGGHYSTTNNNHYVLFNASGYKFIAIALEKDPDQNMINWADSLLQQYSDRRGIIVTHYILNIDGSWGGKGKIIYDTLKHNPNLFLMLCGHMHSEANRADTYMGITIYSLLADYQSYPNGGNGYLRIMTFCPAKHQIMVKTYSPYVNLYETDANSQFNLTYYLNLPLLTDTGRSYQPPMIPGFELIFVICAITLVLLLKRKRVKLI